jgi:transcriptional regulator with XRE-family HTH domain
MRLNLRELRRGKRDLLRRLGDDTRRLREDTGLSQAVVAAAGGISQSYLSRIEAGLVEPSLDVLLRLGAVLGADLACRLYPTTGPLLRDRHQVAMEEGFLPEVDAGWRPQLEVAVYRPVRGVIDMTLEHRRDPDTVAAEFQSELRRVEAQVRWARQKADALASLPESAGRRVSRLLVLRNTAAMRDVARAAEGVLRVAYPARADAIVAALRGAATWPGSGIAWMRIEGGAAALMDGPPRGVRVGR